MKAGTKVKDIKTGRLGTSHGPKIKFGVQWIHVEWEDGSSAIILEECLELIDMWKYEGCNPNQFIDFKKDKDK